MTGNAEDDLTPEQIEDARRCTLALIEARIRDDYEGLAALTIGYNVQHVVATACGLLVELLEDQRIDPLEWIAAKRAELG